MLPGTAPRQSVHLSSGCWWRAVVEGHWSDDAANRVVSGPLRLLAIVSMPVPLPTH